MRVNFRSGSHGISYKPFHLYEMFKKVFPITGNPKEYSNFNQLKIPFENDTLQYWKVYFNFGYYALIIPFRFKFFPENFQYELQSSIIQKILRTISALIAGFYFLMKVRQMYITKNMNPSAYFDIASYFFDTFFLIPMYLSFGQKSLAVEQVFNDIHNSQFSRGINYHSGKASTYITFGLCILCVFHPIWHVIEVFVHTGWNWKSFLAYFINDSEKVFKGIISKSLLDSYGNLIGFISLFSTLVDKTINTYGDLLFVVTVLMFRELVFYFSYALQNNMTCEYAIPTTQIIDHYKWIRNITEKINKATSIITFSFLIGNLPFFATSVLKIFTEGNNFERTVNLIVCFYFFTTLFLAAKACKDIDEIKNWIWKEENYSKIHPLKLTVVLQEISGQSVALNSFGCLTVNYGTVGSIVSIIFTYALLKQQFQGQP